jgi:parallel beta-helix repeat protein
MKSCFPQAGAAATCAAVVLACLALAGPSAAALSDAAVTCGQLITTDTTLDRNLSGCENGLTVADGIHLDLGDHTIHGVGTGTGVRLGEGASVRNGAIRGFGTGISVVLVSNASVTGLTIAGNIVVGVSVSSSQPSHNVQIHGNVIRQNGSGVVISFSQEADVRENRIVENTGDGLNAVRAERSVFENNVVARNGLAGFSLDSTTATIRGNTFQRNGGTGLSIIERVCSFVALYRIGDNEADANGALGIDFHTSASACAPGEDPAPLFAIADQGGNTAARNGDPRECVNVTCSRNRGDL